MNQAYKENVAKNADVGLQSVPCTLSIFLFNFKPRQINQQTLCFNLNMDFFITWGIFYAWLKMHYIFRNFKLNIMVSRPYFHISHGFAIQTPVF